MLQLWPLIKQKTLMRDRFGKEVRKTIFRNPSNNREEEYILFGQRDWSIVLPVTRDNMVVTVLQFKQGCNKIIHELPAGTVDPGEESPEEAVKRELMEETGYQSDTVIFLGPPLWMSSRNSWTRGFTFLALNCEKVREGKVDEMEVIETRLVPLERWIEMARTEIEEASSVVATFRALPHLKV